MPKFNSKEEYEKWKTDRAKEIKENPNKKRTNIDVKSNSQSAQAQLQEFKSSNRKINCPACQTSISINAVACPKCGQPLTDALRLDEVARTNRNQIIIAAVIIGFILLALIGKLLPERYESNSSTTSTGSSTPDSSYSSSEAERTRNNYEQDERRRQRDALQPSIKEMCRQGNDEACREAQHWEDIR